MPSAVALLNYLSCGILWRIFCQTGTICGIFSTYHYKHCKDQRSCDGREGGHYIFCEVFSLYNSPKGSAKLRRAGRGSWDICNMINMTIRELHYSFADFCSKPEFLLILPKVTAKLRWGGGGDIFFRVQRNSIRVQRSSLGSSVAQKGKA